MHVLRDKLVAVAGRLASMTREQARTLVEQAGGRFVQRPTRKTDYLVVGEKGWPLNEDGRLSEPLQAAEHLRSVGHPIEIWSEEQFLQFLGQGDRAQNVHRLYTVEQLTKILPIRSGQIRRWKSLGLIQPVQTRFRVDYFDFAEITKARNLAELMQQGVTVERIRESLAALQRIIPGADVSMIHVAGASSRAPLLFRLPSGELADSNGQLHFDFQADEGEGEPETIGLRPRSSEDWFEAGLEHEEAGELEAAADAYAEALLAGGPDPVLCFNLANVLYALDEKWRAVERYRQAIELDPNYLEAWNNLGNALADLDRPQRAIAAFEQALSIDPSYPDARFNLAATLEQFSQDL